MTFRSTIFANARRSLARAALSLSAAFLASTPVFAQDVPEQAPERNWHLGIALGLGQRDNPLISGDTIDINYAIDLSWYGKRFFFDNGDFGYTLFTDDTLSLNLLGSISNERSFYHFLTGKQLRLNKESAGATPIVLPNADMAATLSATAPTAKELDDLNRDTALPTRRYAAYGGFELLHISPYGDVQAQVLSDISKVHNGQEVWLSWTKPWFFTQEQVSLTLGLQWQSAALLSYYYGVRPQESFSARPAYEASAGINRFVRVQARHSFNAHWQAVGMVEREYLSAAIRHSPIVNAAVIDSVFAGLYYQF
ncbi:MAG: MipA/OmpV family protein [Pseudomonadales bacterium]|jgi:outer membrane protein|nr:MipA/OmpV family protein [Pseudomonadales bacterium]